MKHLVLTLIFVTALFAGLDAQPAQAKGSWPTRPRAEIVTPYCDPLDGLIVYKGVWPMRP
jgi:hypothetical protein